MSGFLLRVYGELVAETRTDADGTIWYRFAYSPSPRLQEATKLFIRDHNKMFRTSYRAAFPKAFKMTLR